MNSKRSFPKLFLEICVFSVILFIAFSFTAIASDIEFITVTCGTGDWGLMGAKVAEIITRDIPGITATSIPGGATINLTKVQRGEAQIGLTHSYAPYSAYHGLPPFKEEHKKLRVMMNNNAGSTVQAIVPRNSDITCISDLANKPYDVCVSTPGKGSRLIILNLLEAYGISVEKINEAGGIAHVITNKDGARLMKDRVLDFVLFPGAIPHASVMDLSISPGVKFLPIDGEGREKFMEILPGLNKAVIPANSYPKNQPPEDVPSVGLFNQFVCSSELPEDLVYEITKAIFKALPEFFELSASLENMSFEMAADITGIPFHPGALKYYAEFGLIEK